MKTRRHRTRLSTLALVVAACALTTGDLSLQPDAAEDAGIEIGQAHAVIGRPLTPVSGAGMARRTARRTSRRVSYRQNAYHGAYGGYGYGYGYAAGAALTALPPNCVRRTYEGAVAYDCAGTFYRPAYDGPDVVYVEID